MSENIPEFGEFVACANYILRPGAYLLVKNSLDEIAVVSTPKGFFLPGGGQSPTETFQETAVREAFEECGLRVILGKKLGIADELVFSESENRYFRKRCVFFSAEFICLDGEGEADHQLIWMKAPQTAALLKHRSQVWACVIEQIE